MRVFLAGCELAHHSLKAGLAGHKYVLMSYYNWECGKRLSEIRRTCELADRFGFEVILDSGLFSFMFGAGAGMKHTEDTMMRYADQYVSFAQKLPIKRLSIIECDAQKVIGTAATIRVREKVFENSGLSVMYVWHVEEGIPGIERLARRYQYLGLGCPELRKVFKGRDDSYHAAVTDLVARIRRASPGALPKIHLLGNTVFADLKNHDAWSADSTSWLSGEKFGSAKILTDTGFKTVRTRDPVFLQIRDRFLEERPEIIEEVHRFTERPKFREALLTSTVAAYQVRLFQEYLDRKYNWQGNEEALKGRL